MFLTKVKGESNSGRQDQGTDEFDEDDKLHAEAKCAAKISNEHQLHQIVDSTIDPSPSLRKKHLELFRHSGFADGLRHKDLLALRECLKHQGRQVSVLTEQKQVLLVQRVNHVLRVVLDDVRVGKDRNPVVLPAFGSLDAVHAETSWKTGNTTKDGFERFGQVVRDEVLKNLNH